MTQERLKFFYKQEAGDEHVSWGGGCCLSQEGPIESFWNIIRQTDLQEEWPRYTEGIMDYIVAEMAVTYSKTLAKLERV